MQHGAWGGVLPNYCGPPPWSNICRVWSRCLLFLVQGYVISFMMLWVQLCWLFWSEYWCWILEMGPESCDPPAPSSKGWGVASEVVSLCSPESLDHLVSSQGPTDKTPETRNYLKQFDQGSIRSVISCLIGCYVWGPINSFGLCGL